MKEYVKAEEFEYIEQMSNDHGGITAEQFSKKFGVQLDSARSWLSKWYSRGYLKYKSARVILEEKEKEGSSTSGEAPKEKRKRGRPKNTQGKYYIDGTCKWWGDFVFDVNRQKF